MKGLSMFKLHMGVCGVVFEHSHLFATPSFPKKPAKLSFSLILKHDGSFCTPTKICVKYCLNLNKNDDFGCF